MEKFDFALAALFSFTGYLLMFCIGKFAQKSDGSEALQLGQELKGKISEELKKQSKALSNSPLEGIREIVGSYLASIHEVAKSEVATSYAEALGHVVLNENPKIKNAKTIWKLASLANRAVTLPAYTKV